jgi:hypothetical protein
VSPAARRYRVYGLVLDSAIPLSCPCVPARGRPDVRLRAGRASRFDNARRLLQLPSTPKHWFECRRLTDGATYLRWAGLFEFLIAPGACAIEYRQLEQATHESFATYLLGQVLSFSLLSFGYEPLHATAVVIDGGAVAFLGDCGYGKSTLGAAFVARGFPILTDDVLALEERDGRWIAHAGPPRLKLFPAVARKVLARGNGDALNPGTSKLVLPLASGESVDRSVPIKALYVLPEPAELAGRAPARVRIAPLSGQEAFFQVIRSAFNLIQVDRARLENQFAMATRLAGGVPLRRLAYPRTLASLGAVCDAVLSDGSFHTAIARHA